MTVKNNMTQHYFAEWNDPYETTDLKPLKQAIAMRDKAKLQAISEELFESYLDVTAALPQAEVVQYAEIMGADLTAIELDICMGELVSHHHPDDIEAACRNCLALGIGFPFDDYFDAAMTENDSEFDIEFFERVVEPTYLQLKQQGRMTVSQYFVVMCTIIKRLDKCEYGTSYLQKLLNDPELDLSLLSDGEYAECLDISLYCYFINPEVFRLFVKRANQRRVTESTKEWQESDEYYLITYQFRYAFGDANAYCGAWEDHQDAFIEAFSELKRSNLVADVSQHVIDRLEEEGFPNLAQAFIRA